MLYSEFYDRTKISITGAEFAEIEKLYLAVKMDKDVFCKQWLKLRNNPLFNELAAAFREADTQGARLNSELIQAKEALQGKEALYKKQIVEQHKVDSAHMEEFAKRVIIANDEDDSKVYDVVEEELGIDFIIKTKYEGGIPLLDEEIKYLVGKL